MRFRAPGFRAGPPALRLHAWRAGPRSAWLPSHPASPRRGAAGRSSPSRTAAACTGGRRACTSRVPGVAAPHRGSTRSARPTSGWSARTAPGPSPTHAARPCRRACASPCRRAPAGIAGSGPEPGLSTAAVSLCRGPRPPVPASPAPDRRPRPHRPAGRLRQGPRAGVRPWVRLERGRYRIISGNRRAGGAGTPSSWSIGWTSRSTTELALPRIGVA